MTSALPPGRECLEASRPLCVLIEQLRSVKPRGANGRSFVELRVDGG
jgi:hypothetical protein